jgi:hypothetical protein
MLPLSMLAAIGCGAEDGGDAGWVHASDALAAHGVAQYRATTTATGQDVLLRDGDAQTIGELSMVQGEGTTTVSLEFRADAWKEVVAAADGKMTLSLDGREATLRWTAGAWTGDGAAQALLADSQPYADFVELVGAEARLGTQVATGPTAATGGSNDKGAPDLGSPRPPALCCGDVVTTGSGWAWYWEPNAQATACKRAVDALSSACALSSGYDCCNVPKSCTACVDWGTGWACSTAGYLQYAQPAGGSCQ